MLLAYNASEADIAAYPGKFKPDTANPTGLFVPRLNGLFARYWTGEGQAGEYHRDEIRNITGNTTGPSYGGIAVPSGAFYRTASTHAVPDVPALFGTAVALDTSRVVPTGPENVPQHYKQPIALYLGMNA